MCLSSARKSTFSRNDEPSTYFWCRIVADNVERARPERGHGGDADTYPDCDAECLFAANAGGFETVARGGVEQRLRLSAGCASGGQHWTALERLGASRQS